MQRLPRSKLSGTSFEIGEELGRLSKPILKKYLSHPVYSRQANAWKKTYPIPELMTAAAQSFPDCWEELRGLSTGCGIDLDDVYIWNCKPDFAKTQHDSSTSFAVNRLANRFIVQEIWEDPCLRPYCHLVDVRPIKRPGFLALYTPGMLPGNSFSSSRAGLVQSVNLLDIPAVSKGVPSSIISRSVLGCGSLLEAIDLLMSAPRIGGAHHILAWSGEFVMLSIEATGFKVTVVPVSNKYAHTNHTVHNEQKNPSQAQNLLSRRRYAKVLEELKLLPDYPTEADVLAWLRKRPGIAAPVSLEVAAEKLNPSMTVFLRSVSSKITVQIFSSGQFKPEKFSFSVVK